MESKAGSILREREGTAADHEDGRNKIAILEEESAKLRKAVEELENAKKSLLERTLRLEKLLAEQQRGAHMTKEEQAAAATATIVFAATHLFMKTFALMREGRSVKVEASCHLFSSLIFPNSSLTGPNLPNIWRVLFMSAWSLLAPKGCKQLIHA